MPVAVFAFLNPALLWGAAAIAVPVLIHLLLRQRPRPRPWAAMRWLMNAALRAQRRYKLTNLLLLLLRCLVIAVLALALARPSITGLGQGGRLVLVVDTTASMGAVADGAGALQAVRDAMTSGAFSHAEVALVTVSPDVRVRSIGDAEALGSDAAALNASQLPGGLDDAADAGADQLLETCTADSDVILISDFRQDEGNAITALLEGRVRSIARWRVGHDRANTVITGVIPPTDLVPGAPTTIDLLIDGTVSEAEIAIDDGLPLPAEVITAPDRARIAIPPMPPGEHIISITLLDDGLLADSQIRVPVAARRSVGALYVSDQPGRMQAALAADSGRIELNSISPGPNLPLPERGLTVLRRSLTDTTRLQRWLNDGGVLWLDRTVLAQMPDLSAPVANLLANEELLPGGRLSSGQPDLDANLDRVTVENIPALTPGAEDELLLQAGDAPMVVAVPQGRGWLIVEAMPPHAENNRFADAGAYPLWVRRKVREFTARLTAAEQWMAGVPSPRDATLRRDGQEITVTANQPLMVAPGLWRQTGPDNEPVLVLPNRPEGQLRQRVGEEVAVALDEAMPETRGADWSLALLILLLAIALGEGALAAWAGRHYGR